MSECCAAGISDWLTLLLSLAFRPSIYSLTDTVTPLHSPPSTLFCSVRLPAVFPFVCLSSWMSPLPSFPVSSFSQHIKKTLDHILTLGGFFLPLPTNKFSFLLSRLTFTVTCASGLLVHFSGPCVEYRDHKYAILHLPDMLTRQLAS